MIIAKILKSPPRPVLAALALTALLTLMKFHTSSQPDALHSDLPQLAWVIEQLDKSAPDSNLCNGGLENGKRIVDETYLRNPFSETTRLACEVDGGSPLKVPDLPAPDDRATRLA